MFLFPAFHKFRELQLQSSFFVNYFLSDVVCVKLSENFIVNDMGLNFAYYEMSVIIWLLGFVAFMCNARDIEDQGLVVVSRVFRKQHKLWFCVGCAQLIAIKKHGHTPAPSWAQLCFGIHYIVWVILSGISVVYKLHHLGFEKSY